MRRRWIAGVALAMMVVAVAAAVAAAATRHDRNAFTLGVPATEPAVTLHHAQRACQQPIRALAPFDEIVLGTGVLTRRQWARHHFLVSVVRRGGPTLTAAEVDRRLGPTALHHLRLPSLVAGGQILRVCVRNLGHRRLQVYGSIGVATSPSQAFVEGHRTESDLGLVFWGPPRTILEELPTIMRRAALFKVAGMPPGVLWAMFGIVLLVVPLALAVALSNDGRARRGDDLDAASSDG